jgi:hypothetical protein
MICPCKGCADRAVGCHGQCEPYQEYNAWRESIRKARQLDKIGRYAKIDSVIDWGKMQFRTRRK